MTPIKYATDNTPPPEGYCPACWSNRRVIPLRPNAAECWVCREMKPKSAPEIEAPAQATLELEIP